MFRLPAAQIFTQRFRGKGTREKPSRWLQTYASAVLTDAVESVFSFIYMDRSCLQNPNAPLCQCRTVILPTMFPKLCLENEEVSKQYTVFIFIYFLTEMCSSVSFFTAHISPHQVFPDLLYVSRLFSSQPAASGLFGKSRRLSVVFLFIPLIRALAWLRSFPATAAAVVVRSAAQIGGESSAT